MLAGPAGAGGWPRAGSTSQELCAFLSLFPSHRQTPGLSAQVWGNLVLVLPLKAALSTVVPSVRQTPLLPSGEDPLQREG